MKSQKLVFDPNYVDCPQTSFEEHLWIEFYKDSSESVVELLESIRYKLHMFDIPINGPMNYFVLINQLFITHWSHFHL